ncbi:hypothetical protein [Streptomyces boninensis]|uniref:hypothetical protein n=1 Tax=Streptomyces boninensis TaxID=2039455 RepID=UPI003B2151E6
MTGASTPTRAALALATLAAAAAAWGGTSWYAAAHDDSAAFAKTRDDVLAAGEQGVQNLQTLDYRDIDDGLDTWESSATGDLLTELEGGREDFEKQVKSAKSVTTAKVLSGAVTELDERAGKASVMVAVRITVDTAKEKPGSKESRILGELTRTDDGWKLSALSEAPVEGAAGAGQ